MSLTGSIAVRPISGCIAVAVCRSGAVTGRAMVIVLLLLWGVRRLRTRVRVGVRNCAQPVRGVRGLGPLPAVAVRGAPEGVLAQLVQLGDQVAGGAAAPVPVAADGRGRDFVVQ